MAPPVATCLHVDEIPLESLETSLNKLNRDWPLEPSSGRNAKTVRNLFSEVCVEELMLFLSPPVCPQNITTSYLYRAVI